MVKAPLKKVFIKNLKSLHDCEIDIGKMNVVVGANASLKGTIYEVAIGAILSTINSLIILNPLDIRSMKSPQPFRREATIPRRNL